MPVLMSLSQAVKMAGMIRATAKASPGPALVRVGREPGGAGVFVERIEPPFGGGPERIRRLWIADEPGAPS